MWQPPVSENIDGLLFIQSLAKNMSKFLWYQWKKSSDKENYYVSPVGNNLSLTQICPDIFQVLYITYWREPGDQQHPFTEMALAERSIHLTFKAY